MNALTFQNKHRKITVLACFLLLLLLSLSACTALNVLTANQPIASLGRYESRVFYTSGGFQDFTDYAKYHYTSVKIGQSPYFTKVSEADPSVLDRHLDDFEKWIKAIREADASSEVVVHYDFDRSIIDGDDYICIESEEHTWSDGHTSLVKYNIYFFDTQTQTLYYFHNNI